jgi:hypothetical protein
MVAFYLDETDSRTGFALLKFGSEVSSARPDNETFVVSGVILVSTRATYTHVYLSKVRLRESLNRVVGEKILRSQLVADLLERLVERAHAGDVIVLSSSVVRNLDECMFAAGVAPGARFDRHIDKAVNQRFGLLSGTQRLFVINAAAHIPAVSD